MSGEAFGLTDQSTDETPELDENTVDLDAWISGIKPTVRSVTLYGRADVLAEIDEVEREIKRATTASGTDDDDDEGSLEDETPAALQDRLEALYRTFADSALTFRVQGRNDEWRDKAQRRLKKQGINDENEQTLRMLRESIVSPAGITYEHLRHLQDVSEAQIKLLLVAWSTANHTPPRVGVPFSQGPSGSRGGRTS